ncbi:MAG: DUF4097 family beta strand repeat-containing protein [Bacillota bacterium]
MAYRNKIVLIAFLILLTAILSAGCMFEFVRAREEERKTVAAADELTLELHNRNGNVDIHSWNQDYVDVVAIKESVWGKDELEHVRILVDSTTEKICVETEYLKRNARVSVMYQIRVPANVSVSIVETSNGSINIQGVSGDLIAETSNGSVEIRNVDGSVRAATSNGKIDITGVAGVQEVKTSNGSISVEMPQITGDTSIRTSNGSIKVYLADDLDANLEADTSNGKIDVHAVSLTVETVNNTYLKGKLGSGGALLDLSTSNGSIDLFVLK